MKILLINKFHYLKGGSEKYYFELANLLKQHGHEVAFFSMKNEKNIKTDCKEYFVDEIDLNSNNKLKALEVIYSKNNKKLMTKCLEEFKPDIVHINNFQRQLSASIISAIKEKNIPIVYTAHDLQSVCPNSSMLCNGIICEKCLYGSKFNCLKNRCSKNSVLKSLLLSLEANYYKNKKIYANFDTIISPSNFVGNMLKKSGIKTKIVILHNFIILEQFKNIEIKDENYAFYFGRLSEEKGILNLINAFSMQPNGKLYIAGDGPEKENINKFIKEHKLKSRIKLLGYLNTDDIKNYISKCSFVVVPSVCYENCPYSILESLVLSKAIVGSNIGGIPELIEENVNGCLYEYNDITKLKNIINELFSNKEKRNIMGKESLNRLKKYYTDEIYYKKLINIYREVVENKSVS